MKRITLLMLVFSVLLMPMIANQANADSDHPKPATRIVSMAPSFTETLFAIGAEDRLVGRSRFCNRPEAALAIPDVGGLLDPNLERIVALHPDLIILLKSHSALGDELNRLNLPVLELKHDTLDDVFTNVIAIGKAAGMSKTAEALAAHMRAELDAVRAAVAGKPKVRTLLIVGHDPGALRGLSAAGPGGFHDALLQAAGGFNALKPMPRVYGPVAIEAVLSARPEAILIISDQTADAATLKAERALWQPLAATPAVANGRIYWIGGSHTMLPGPSVAQTAWDFARRLHGVQVRASGSEEKAAPKAVEGAP